MSFKKLFTTMVFSAALLGFAGSAPAAEDINIYGSSSQFNFWASMTAPFMTSQGCKNVVTAYLDSKNAIIAADCNWDRILELYTGLLQGLL